ncbi:MAG: GvpL/GvpF family gas vesicle protein [Myxococcota bacterium]|nr:GvpL/GvpF family gas vesicle protein [Myxococcota bacterium]
MTDGTSVYAYCVVGGPRAPSLRGAPPGVPGSSTTRLLDVTGDLRLVVADVPAGAWSEDAISEGLRDVEWVSERALAHEATIAHFLDADALIPMKAFTLFRSEERARAHVLEREADVRAAMERVAGCVELGVRLRFDEEASRRAQVAAAAGEKPSSGAAFLARKKGLKESAMRARQDAMDAARSAAEQIAAHAREMRVLPPPEGIGATSLLIETACLVESSGREALERAVEAMRVDMSARGVDLEVTGPWAPYHFIGART